MLSFHSAALLLKLFHVNLCEHSIVCMFVFLSTALACLSLEYDVLSSVFLRLCNIVWVYLSHVLCMCVLGCMLSRVLCVYWIANEHSMKIADIGPPMITVLN